MEAATGDLKLLGRLVNSQGVVFVHRGIVVSDKSWYNHGDHNPSVLGVEGDRAATGVDRDHLERSGLKVLVLQIEQDGVRPLNLPQRPQKRACV